MHQTSQSELPAHDIERQVVVRLQSFLQSGKDIMDALSLPGDPPARTQQIMAGAAKQFDQLSSNAPSVVKGFVRKVVHHVVVHPDRIEVEVGKRELCAALSEEQHVLLTRPVTQQLERLSGDAICLEIEARVKRCGGEMRLVLPPDRRTQVLSHPASSLRVRAHGTNGYWLAKFLVGEQLPKSSV